MLETLIAVLAAQGIGDEQHVLTDFANAGAPRVELAHEIPGAHAKETCPVIEANCATHPHGEGTRLCRNGCSQHAACAPRKVTILSEEAQQITLSEQEIAFIAIRAQGAGGRNVNKVSNAVHLRFDIKASSLPQAVKARLRHTADKRISAEGIVVIKAQRYRSLDKNRFSHHAVTSIGLRGHHHLAAESCDPTHAQRAAPALGRQATARPREGAARTHRRLSAEQIVARDRLPSA